MSDPINGDISIRAQADTAQMEWTPSPSGSVWRKRVHLVGEPEAGQVTSVVRYDANSSFPPHDHPGGEEILVLEGIFSDEHGDWPAGTALLNPEGFRHAPFSREGCVIFVKLRQYAGTERAHVVIDTHALAWNPTSTPGLDRKLLYEQAGFRDTMCLERWAPGSSPLIGEAAEGVEIFVIEGEFADDEGSHGAGVWLRIPAGAKPAPQVRSPRGCTVYVKRAGLGDLNSDPSAD
jgi:anti-sigma factor ChrR (cupin superfamily)